MTFHVAMYEGVQYEGTRVERDGRLVVKVFEAGRSSPNAARGKKLPPRFDLRKHSPTGYECGYDGSGPAQLALALVVDHLDRNVLRAQAAAVTLEIDHDLRAADLSERVAELVYQDYKREVVARLPRDGAWILTEEEIARAVDGIVARKRKRTAAEIDLAKRKG